MNFEKLWIVAGLVLSAMVGCAGGERGAAMAERASAGVHFRTVTLRDGSEHRFAVYVPWGVAKEPGRHAAAVFLNGSGECGTDGSKHLAVGMMPAMMIDPAAWPLVGVFPQKPKRETKWEDHTEMVLACVEMAVAEFELDRERIALTGLSQGGHGTWMIGTAEASVWSCVAPICGPMSESERVGVAERLPAGMPVWAFHGLADNVVRAGDTEDLVGRLKALGRTPKVTLYEGVGHNSWDKAYRDEGLGVWMAAQRR